MTKTEIRSWLKQEFQPLTVATVDDTIDQIIDNAVRYWNTHSAFKIFRMYDAVVSGSSIELDLDIKSVVKVYPAQTPSWVLQDHPLWSLLGITILDNLTSDLIQLAESYRNYKIYLGKDFRWKFVGSQDPSVKSKLFVLNIPVSNTNVCVVGTKRILSGEDIKSEHILDWILYYSKALLKITEGNTLRKANLITAPNDGQELVNEGIEEKKELQERLAHEGRWAVFGKRV